MKGINFVMNQEKNKKLRIGRFLSKKIVILAISIVIVLIINPPIKYRKPNEKFYQEHGIEYNIVKCPECGRDAIDSEHNRYDFCQNCGAPLFDADERMLEFLEKVHENLKPTLGERIWSITKKVILYITIIIIYCLLNKIIEILKKIISKVRKDI